MRRGRWFLPENPDVKGMLRGQCAITLEGAETLVAWTQGDEGAVARLIDIEHRGDDRKRELVEELREAFVTPLEPEDIFALSRGIDWILDYCRDLTSEAQALGCGPDRGLGEMAAIVVEAVRHIDEALASAGDDWDAASAAADRAIHAERRLEHAYYAGMADLLEIEPRSDRISLRELYRSCERIGEALIGVAERIVYAGVKQS